MTHRSLPPSNIIPLMFLTSHLCGRNFLQTDRNFPTLYHHLIGRLLWPRTLSLSCLPDYHLRSQPASERVDIVSDQGACLFFGTFVSVLLWVLYASRQKKIGTSCASAGAFSIRICDNLSPLHYYIVLPLQLFPHINLHLPFLFV